MTPPRTLFDKIWDSHVIEHEDKNTEQQWKEPRPRRCKATEIKQ